MMQFFGLDFGTHTLKAVELSYSKGGKPQLVAFGSVPAPEKSIESDSSIDQADLIKSIKSLLKESGVKSRKVVTAFPESKIFSRVIEFPPLSGQELNNAIEWESERFVPLPKDKVKISWMILEEGQKPQGENSPGKKMRIFLVAAPLDLVERYLNIMEGAGLEPIAFESEIIGVVRALSLGMQEGPTTLIISLGAKTTDLCIVDGGIIQFTRSIGTGGVALARAIERELGFELSQAEEYKRAYGLLEDKLEGKILKVVKPVFDIIVNEIERAVISYQTKMPMRPVKRVVLTGRTSQLPGVVVYLAESLGIEVQIGDPWIGISVPPQFETEIHSLENQTRYAVAVGLALKKFER